jgi:hypothetical protein
MEQQGEGRANGEEDQFRSSVISRRKLLKISGIAAAAGLAGCSGEDDSSADTPGSTPARTRAETETATATSPGADTATDPTTQNTEMTATEQEKTDTTTETDTTTSREENTELTGFEDSYELLPDATELYESGAIDSEFVKETYEDSDIFENPENAAKALVEWSRKIYRVREMRESIDGSILQKMEENAVNQVSGRGFVDAGWEDVIDKTSVGNGDLGSVALDKSYEDIKKALGENGFQKKGEENGREVYTGTFADARFDKEVELSVKDNTINWASSYTGANGQTSPIGDLAAARKVLDQTTNGQKKSWVEGSEPSNKAARKMRQYTEDAHTIDIGPQGDGTLVKIDIDGDGEKEPYFAQIREMEYSGDIYELTNSEMYGENMEIHKDDRKPNGEGSISELDLDGELELAY